MIGFLRLRRGVKAHLHGFPQKVHAAHVARAVRRLHKGVGFRHPLHGVFISVLLVFQAAHQPPAGAGNLGGVQAEVLGLGHFNRNRQKRVQKLGAAKGPPADAESADHFRLVPHANLPQLDPRPKHSGQIPHQLPEVHPPVGGKIKDNFGPLKAKGNVYQLHVQPVVLNFLLTDVKGLALPLAVVFHGVPVVFRGHADHAA
ncbi:hypothetical protein SDC9_161473 [bioreactor metagenome]|uniref:Uncharacterized protein n=1 Tax=bioreactor metagenome TaxID=1076179 RepID=A0A645FIF9_9ZZZZ